MGTRNVVIHREWDEDRNELLITLNLSSNDEGVQDKWGSVVICNGLYSVVCRTNLLW